MASLPALHSGALAFFGSTFTTGFATKVIQFTNDTEQRWRAKAPLEDFMLVYMDVDGKDTSTMREFFENQKGMFLDVALSNTFDMDHADIPHGPFHYCAFAQDSFDITESEIPNCYNFTLKIKQIRKN